MDAKTAIEQFDKYTLRDRVLRVSVAGDKNAEHANESENKKKGMLAAREKILRQAKTLILFIIPSSIKKKEIEKR